jgi:hypothetical protein
MSDTLASRLLSDPKKRPQILTDCERIIEDEVKDKGGLTGLAIKGAYKIVCAVKPGVIREVLDSLLDDFVNRLEPFYAEQLAKGDGKGFGDHMNTKKSAVADALLGITDDRAKVSKNQTLKGAYERLRPQGKKHVEDAIPRVGRTLSRYL